MIAIQCLAGSRRQNLRVNRVQIDRCQGRRFKFHKLTVEVLFAAADDQLVFNPDAKFSFDVNTRFIGDHHSRFQPFHFAQRRRLLPADSVRTFMHVQQISDAMTGAFASTPASSWLAYLRDNHQIRYTTNISSTLQLEGDPEGSADQLQRRP